MTRPQNQLITEHGHRIKAGQEKHLAEQKRREEEGLTPSDWQPGPKDVQRRYMKLEWEDDFFEQLARLGVVSQAAKAVGIDRAHCFRKRRADPEFAKRWEEALETVRDRVRETIMTRTLEGTLKPIYQNGELVGWERQVDNKLLMWLAERMLPKEYHLPERMEVGAISTVRFEFKLGEAADDAEVSLEEGEFEEVKSELPAGKNGDE